jgi:multiple sugar transport system ATP-binding protein
VEIKRLQRELGATTLYVTHDQIEAMTMADLIAVMREGKLQQWATPAELYEHPANLFVARFCGSPPMNILDGEIADGRFGHAAGSLPLRQPPTTGPVKLGFRPEHAELVEPGTPNSLDGEIYVVEPLGNETLVTVRLEGELLNIRAPASFDTAVGERCAVRPLGGRMHLFEQESGNALAMPTERGAAGAGHAAAAGI